MHIKDITLKNFLSYGEQPVTIQFDRHNTNMLTAKNGVGKCVEKSTLVDIDFVDEETRRKFIEFVDK